MFTPKKNKFHSLLQELVTELLRYPFAYAAYTFFCSSLLINVFFFGCSQEYVKPSDPGQRRKPLNVHSPLLRIHLLKLEIV